jgi:hypothetical protein
MRRARSSACSASTSIRTHCRSRPAPGRLPAAVLSRRAAITFLALFGTLYFADGVLGVFIGSGYLDLSIITQGISDAPARIRFLSSVPHLGLGAFGMFCGFTASAKAPSGRRKGAAA